MGVLIMDTSKITKNNLGKDKNGRDVGKNMKIIIATSFPDDHFIFTGLLYRYESFEAFCAFHKGLFFPFSLEELSERKKKKYGYQEYKKSLEDYNRSVEVTNNTIRILELENILWSYYKYIYEYHDILKFIGKLDLLFEKAQEIEEEITKLQYTSETIWDNKQYEFGQIIDIPDGRKEASLILLDNLVARNKVLKR